MTNLDKDAIVKNDSSLENSIAKPKKGFQKKSSQVRKEIKTITEPKETENSEVLELDAQTRDMLKRVREQKLVSGGKDPFFVSEKEKQKGFEYKWVSTDKDCPETLDVAKDMGWREVEGFRTVPTGGYTVDGKPGKHILMRLNKIIYAELEKIQNEVNERKKNAVFGSELLSKDGGKNKLGSSTKLDTSAKDDFLSSL